MLAVGLMSGTSRDGMDAALVETDGEDCVVCKESITLPYEEGFREELARLCALQNKEQGLQDLAQNLATRLGSKLADIAYRAVAELLTGAKEGAREGGRRVEVVGFHGHTVFHAPERGETLQIGDGARLARLCKTRVVCNFRQKDMEYGGQGAPLAPLYHRAVARQLRASKRDLNKRGLNKRGLNKRDLNKRDLNEHPLVFVNIGGVANVTWIAPPKEQDEEAMLAFDVGVGNALLDDWVARRTGQPFDKDGELASKGRVCARTLLRLLEFGEPFFALAPPKSLDRDHFSLALLEEASLSLEDGAATLTAFLVESLWLARRFFPSQPHLWLLCGGGRKNRAVVEGLRRKLAEDKLAEDKRRTTDRIEALAIDTLGFDGDALEAQAFAYLAVRRLRGLPSAYPSLTGASEATCGGDLYSFDGKNPEGFQPEGFQPEGSQPEDSQPEGSQPCG